MKEIIFQVLKNNGTDIFMHFMRRDESEDEEFLMQIATQMVEKISKVYTPEYKGELPIAVIDCLLKFSMPNGIDFDKIDENLVPAIGNARTILAQYGINWKTK